MVHALRIPAELMLAEQRRRRLADIAKYLRRAVFRKHRRIAFHRAPQTPAQIAKPIALRQNVPPRLCPALRRIEAIVIRRQIRQRKANIVEAFALKTRAREVVVLALPVDLTQHQYEALHDGRIASDLQSPAFSGYIVDRIG